MHSKRCRACRAICDQSGHAATWSLPVGACQATRAMCRGRREHLAAAVHAPDYSTHVSFAATINASFAVFAGIRYDTVVQPTECKLSLQWWLVWRNATSLHYRLRLLCTGPKNWALHTQSVRKVDYSQMLQRRLGQSQTSQTSRSASMQSCVLRLSQ